MTSVLFVGEANQSDLLAGPGRRVGALAECIGRTHSVTCLGADDDLLAAISEHDITVSRPGLLGLKHLRLFKDASKYLVVDLVIPQPVEGLHYFSQCPDGADRYATAQRRLRRMLAIGDLFLTASETQRFFWLGAILTNRTLPPAAIAADPCLETLAVQVPTGIDQSETITSEPIRGRLLWGGGLWDWTDPLLLVRAVAMVNQTGKVSCSIHFPGTRHPNDTVPPSKLVEQVEREAVRLGLTDQHLYIEEGWRGRTERLHYLSTAHIGVSLHSKSLEARLSWRSRILDYLSAGIPVILSAGCPLAKLVDRYGAGIVVEPGSLEQCVEAIELLCSDETHYRHCVSGARQLRRELSWDRLVSPLSAYCAAPYKAADFGSFSWSRLVKLIVT